MNLLHPVPVLFPDIDTCHLPCVLLHPVPALFPDIDTSAARPSSRGARIQSLFSNVLTRSSFLKHRILAVLSSQDLIVKRATRAAGDKTATHKFHLAATTTGTAADAAADASSSSTPPAYFPTWDVDAHWSRILSGDSPSALAHEYAAFKRQLAADKRTDWVARAVTGTSTAGQLRDLPSERDIWAWDRRKAGLTTDLERTHLSARRARARPGKERERLGAQAQAQALGRYGVVDGRPMDGPQGQTYFKEA